MKSRCYCFVVLGMIAGVLVLSGCATKLSRARFKNKGPLVPIYTYDNSYEDKSPEAMGQIYLKNYVYWKSAHEELLDSFGSDTSSALAQKSMKHCEAYYDYIQEYLQKLEDLLPEPDKTQMHNERKRYEALKGWIMDDNIKDSRRLLLLSRLKGIKRDIVARFSPYKEHIESIFQSSKK